MCLGAATGPAAGQSLSATAAATALEHRVDAGTGVEVSRGPLVGATLALDLHHSFEVAVTAELGTLRPDGPGVERDVAQLGFLTRVHLGTWFTAEAAARARSFTASIARQHWNTVYVGGAARVPFAGGRWSGSLHSGVYPVVAVNGLSGVRLAVAAAAGVEYRAAPVRVAVRYWVERYDFRPASGITRLEQVTGLTATVTLQWVRAPR